MKNIYKYLIMVIVVSSTVFYSCETTDLDLLENPNTLSKADPNLLLNRIQVEYWSSMANFNDNGGALARVDYFFGRNYEENLGPDTMNGPWGNLYSDMMPDIAAIEALHNPPDKDYSFHLGISKTMQAHLLMMLVDFIGDIPYTQAGNPNEYPEPSVDDGQSVYTAALALLDEAKTLLDGASGGTATDLYYQGDADKWIKFINTLKMRADLTVGNYQAVVDATGVIESSADDFQFSFGTNELQPDTRHPDYEQDYRPDGANIYQSHWLINLMIGDAEEWRALGHPFGSWDGTNTPINDPRRRYYFYRQNWNTPGNFSLMVHSAVGSLEFPDAFGVDNANGESLQCTLQLVPSHYEFTPDEYIWCSMPLGYWGRIHGNDEGIPPDNFTRTAVGVYPAGGSFDNQVDIPEYASGSGVSNIPHGAVGLGNGAGGAGIEPIMLASYVDFMKAEASLALGNAAAAATYMEAGMSKSISKVMSFGSLDGSADLSLAPDEDAVGDFIEAKIDEFNNADLTTGVDGFGFPVAKDKFDLLGEQYFVALYGGAADAYNFIRRTGYPRTLSRNVEADPGRFPRSLKYPGSEIVANPNIHQKSDLSTQVFWDNGVLNPAN